MCTKARARRVHPRAVHPSTIDLTCSSISLGVASPRVARNASKSSCPTPAIGAVAAADLVAGGADVAVGALVEGEARRVVAARGLSVQRHVERRRGAGAARVDPDAGHLSDGREDRRVIEGRARARDRGPSSRRRCRARSTARRRPPARGGRGSRSRSRPRVPGRRRARRRGARPRSERPGTAPPSPDAPAGSRDRRSRRARRRR